MDEQQTTNSKPQDNNKLQTEKEEGKPYDLRERLLLFSRRLIRVSMSLPKIIECQGIRKQLVNSATSIGANFEEADGALSKRDFINKVVIARKEAKELKYWLKVIDGTLLRQDQVRTDIGEAGEIVKILSAILIKLGAKPKR